MSILSISVLAFVFVISIWSLFPGLVIKYVNTKSFTKDVNFVLTVAYGGLGWDAVAKIGNGQVVACLANVVAAYVVYRVQDKYFGK